MRAARVALALLLVPGAAFGQLAPVTLHETIDFGLPLVERYDTRNSGTGSSCEWNPEMQWVADRARYVLLSGELATDETDTPASVPPIEVDPTGQDSLARLPARCLNGASTSSYRTWQKLRALQDQLVALRPPELGEIVFEIRFRPDVVSFTRLAEPGFDCDWLVPLDPGGPSWAATDALLTSPTSDLTDPVACGGECEFIFRYGTSRHEVPAYVRAKCQPSSDYDDFVGYAPHICGSLGGGNDAKKPFPNEMLGDLTDPGYRAFLVQEAQTALSILRPGTLINIGFKAGQYFCRVPTTGDPAPTQPKARNTPEWWIGGAGQLAGEGCSAGSKSFATHQAYCTSGDTPWIGKPLAYGYPEYMAGLKALADDFAAAGIPYAFDGDRKPWWDATWGFGTANCAPGCGYFDDEATAANENEMFRDIMRGARRVYMPQVTNANDTATEGAMRADLALHGVAVEIRDSSQ